MPSTARPTREPASDIARRRTERRLASGRKSDARWQQIVDGAARAFQRLGYAQATLEDVAAEVGINRATLYYYVGTKEELLASLLHRPMEAMRVGLEAIVAEGLSARETLARGLRAYAAAMADSPELFVFVGENIHKVMSGRGASDIQRSADAYGRVLAGIIARGAQAGEFRRDIEPQLATLGIIGMFNWTYRWFNPRGPKTLPEIGDVFIDLALASLEPRPDGTDRSDSR